MPASTPLRSPLWSSHARASPYSLPSRAPLAPQQGITPPRPERFPTREELPATLTQQLHDSATVPAAETAHGDPVASDARLDGSVAPAGLHDGSVASAGLIDGSVAPAGRHDDSAAPAGRRDGSVAPAERLDSWVARAAAEPATATPAVTTVSEEVATAESAATLAPDDLYQLLVRPIVKASINQRDTSAETLSDVVFSGRLFDGIMEAIWEKFSSRVKKYAVKTDGVWSVETPQFAAWPKLMQFKMKKRVVDSTKSDQAWKQWLVAARGATVTLMIYEFGMAIPTAKDRDDFMKACILPEETDRAGASAESSLREVVEALREEWGTTFQAVSVVWRMWANDIARNRDRSTWSADIANPPPRYIANLLAPAESLLEEHLSGVTRSASVALDCVRASIADCHQLRRHLEAAGRFLEDQEQRLMAREAIIEGIICDVVPPSPSEIIDPLPQIENVEDTEHAE